jgi:hypothetical protein
MHGSFFDECIGLMAALTPRKHMSMANWTILAAVICVAYSYLAQTPLPLALTEGAVAGGGGGRHLHAEIQQ